MKNDLMAKLSSGAGMSKGQKALSEYILNNFDKAAFMTAAKLGSVTGVSESTVVRFAVSMGYEGYPEFQTALRELLRTKLTSVQRMEVSDGLIKGDVVESVLSADITNIRGTMESLSRTDFENAVNYILGAEHIYVIGMRSSAFLAGFITFNFRYMFRNVTQVQTTSGSEIFEQLLRAGEKDVIFAISFPRYSSRIITAVDFAKSKGCKVIALTDGKSSPIAAQADACLYAKSDMASFADSLVAPLTVIDALNAAISSRKKDELSNVFSQLEKIWDDYNVYDKER